MSRWNKGKGTGRGFTRLVSIMARLRGRNGCPWDRAQTIDSLRPYLIEEAYEVLSAIEDGTEDMVREELGDLLLQVVFLSRLYEDRRAFTIDDVSETICRKLIRRHPHVFGAARADTPEEVMEIWSQAKSRNTGSVLDGIPKRLPALLKAQKTSEKASRVGFDWPSLDGVVKKLREEMREFAGARSKEEKEEELGDVLFTLVNMARRLGINAETALQKATSRFRRRFHRIEKVLGEKIHSASLKEMDRLWNRAKDL